MAKRKDANKYSLHNKVKIVRGGAEYFRLIDEIADGAQYFLHLQTYIFDEDETGKKVADSLMRAAARKVKVYMLVDGFASKNLSRDFISRLKSTGVNFHFFNPFFRGGSFYIGRRLHHKIIVADSRVCMVAGINISNRYNDIGETKAWLDWAVYASGEVAKGISDVSVEVWNRSVIRRKCMSFKGTEQFPLPEEECAVRIRRNDWVYKKIQITRSYRELFDQARKEITMMTSYFWPPYKLLRRMAAASRRGVDVKLVLSARADVPLNKYAEKYLYDWLFRNKIAVYEYQANILHGKITVCDNSIFTIGSYNLNNISAFASVELNLDIKNEALATNVNDTIESIIKNDCKQITPADFAATNNLVKRLGYYLSYRLIHILFYLFTFYFRQKNGQEL